MFVLLIDDTLLTEIIKKEQCKYDAIVINSLTQIIYGKLSYMSTVFNDALELFTTMNHLIQTKQKILIVCFDIWINTNY